MANRFSELYDAGHEAFRASRNREAALFYAQAKQAAELVGERAQAFQAGCWEAHSWMMAGEAKRAFGLLFSLLRSASENAPPRERWFAETTRYDLWVTLEARSYQSHKAQLDQLDTYATQHPGVPAGDIPLLRAYLAEEAADWPTALCGYEQTWTVHDGDGYGKCWTAAGSVRVLLQLNREDEATRWLEVLGSTQQDQADERSSFHRCQALLALYRLAPTDYAPVCAALEQDLLGSQITYNTATRYLIARLYLLQRSDDPESRLHPARAVLRQKPESAKISRKWERFLILADFRLASLRFALALPACEDLYYRTPQVLPTSHPILPADYPHRSRRAHRACARLLKLAQKRDHLMECQYYREVAAARAQRLQELEQAARGTPLD